MKNLLSITWFTAGKNICTFGPGPVVFHLPSLILTGKHTPTGLIIIVLIAATAVVFYAILSQWQHPDESLRIEKSIFSLVFAFNGYSLLMAAVPSIHHEAICSGMFFLLVGLYYVLKSAKNNFELGLLEASVSGTCFCLCVLSRFSYVLTVIVLVFIMIIGRLRSSLESELFAKRFFSVAVLGIITSAGIVGALAYNYLRFGNFSDFGVGYMQTLYRDYFLHGNYFRYDHIPYNLWDYFFRLPQLLPDFPYLGLPFHILEIKSLRSAQYFLMHVNEFSVSVFVLIPVLLFCFFCSVRRKPTEPVPDNTLSQIIIASVLLQLIPLSLTIASAARYYFDFLPLMFIMAFAGYVRIKSKLTYKYMTLGLVASVSLVFSFWVPIGSLIFYSSFINYRSPLLDLW